MERHDYQKSFLLDLDFRLGASSFFNDVFTTSNDLTAIAVLVTAFVNPDMSADMVILSESLIKKFFVAVPMGPQKEQCANADE